MSDTERNGRTRMRADLGGTPAGRFLALDAVKAIALLWILLNHIVEQALGTPYIANPNAAWPPLSERLAQLAPLDVDGLGGMLLNAVRYLGWAGDQGVQLFIVASGFGLTWGILLRQGNSRLRVRDFYVRRLGRIVPMWWAAHLVFGLLFVLAGNAGLIASRRFLLSFLGVRFTSSTLYYLAPAWWFIGLILQLYLVYPLLWAGMRRLGPFRAFLVGSAICLPLRALGLYLFSGYLEVWARGGIFITRFPEFAFGASIAWVLLREPERIGRALTRAPTLLAAVVTYVLGNILSVTLWGMTVAPLLQAASLFVLLHAVLTALLREGGAVSRLLSWVGRHSYSFYLAHHPFVLQLIPTATVISGSASSPPWVGLILLVLAGSVAVAAVLEWVGEWLPSRFRRGVSGSSVRRLVWLTAAVGMVSAGGLLGTELYLRAKDPQEILGWGERPSLEPHPTLGWRLRPSAKTRLRWESYDYVLESNSLGFTGPEYTVEKPEGVYRIMTLGDAYTSAEGVDTEEAWPRALERSLHNAITARSDAGPPDPDYTRVEVLNFGVTGYGPLQYALLAEEHIPRYRPDLLIIAFFVNDYQDALEDPGGVVGQIGFGRPPADGLYSLATLSNLRRFLRARVVDPLLCLRGHAERTHGYFLGNFRFFEIGNRYVQEDTGIARVRECLSAVRRVAESEGCSVLLAMVPAPIQVCGADALSYFPSGVDLTDSSRFDLDLPQRTTASIGSSLGWRVVDLRSAFSGSEGGCPYQPRNMHWTAAGHERVATYLRETVLENGLLREKEP